MKYKGSVSRIAVALAAALILASTAHAAPPTQFVGHWFAIDSFDGSDIRLTIAGPASGPLRITWIESFFTLCSGGPGIGTGTGSPSNPNELDAEIFFQCFTTGATLDYAPTFIYDPGTDTLTDGVDTWNRVGRP